ncbi:jhy protein homolog [Aplysia californica]|uniref:Jhy protein homolog n=1 Tax=Aplysia californica TaxID=6500 RepID=A0ABM0KAV6_APLCA|nr:jhy protein homolog [Aplysia californica]
MNPYGKVPPIPRSSEGEHPSSAPPDQGGSYMDSYLREKARQGERPWYRVYGLKDYRKMQKEVRLGTLGPDLDTVEKKERKEKVSRQNEYAKQVMEKNRTELVKKKPPAFPRPKEDDDIINKARVAKEYAKTVPKPTVKAHPTQFNSYELSSEQSPIAKHHKTPSEAGSPTGSQRMLGKSPSQKNNKKPQKEMDVLDIEKLRQRYEEDKQNEALIRRNSATNRDYY